MTLESITENFKRPCIGRRLAVLAISLTTMGVCIAAFKTVGFGTDPSSTFVLGVSGRTGVYIGNCQLAFNLIMFIPVIRFDLSRIGIGTIGNMVGVGYIADFCMRMIEARTPPEGFSTAARLLMFAVSMACFLIAASFYIVVDMGVAPYDAIPQLISMHTNKLSARAVRMLWDVLILSTGFLLGATVGLTTLITGFCLGPAISFVSSRAKRWFE